MFVSLGLRFVNLSLILLLASLLNFATTNSLAKCDDNNTCAASEPVKIGIYFESLCPDSRRFFLNQLVPTFKDIGSIMQTNLVPFGHARILGINKMICQHGARECEGNRLMACIVTQPNATELSIIETIGCVFENRKKPEECVKNNLPGVSFADIETCKTSNVSFRKMAEYETETGKPDYIPKLTFNGQFSEDIQQGLEYNLKRYVCEHYNGTKPDGCKNLPEIIL